MKLFSIFIFIFSTFTVNINADDCDDTYKNFPHLKKEGWSLRIDDKLDTYGCGIIELYDYMRESDNIIMMDAIDDDPEILQEIQKLFQNKSVFSVIHNSEIVKKILLKNSDNRLFLENINYLFDSYLNYAKRKQITNDPVYLNYFLLPAANAKNKKDLKLFYHSLTDNIGIEGLNLFTFMYSAISEDYKFKYLLENFLTIKKSLSKEQLKKIVQFPAYLAYFLYPPAEEMKLYGGNIKYKQKEFQKLMISIYKNVYSFYEYKQGDENSIALRTIEEVFPYIVTNKNYNELNQLFNILAKNGFINELWTRSEDICDKNTFAIFADDNLNNLLRLQKQENSLYHFLLETNEEDRSVFSLFYVSNVFAKFNHKEWEIFKSLLYGLPQNMYTNILVLKQLDTIDYFKTVIQYPDYNDYIKANDDDSNGKSARKYKFILFTSYPSDNDPSPYYYLSKGYEEEAKQNLVKLYSKNINDLESHNFTKFEQNMALIDTIDNSLMVAAIVAAPFTGGISLSYVAIKQAGKAGAKKGIKYLAKKIALKSKKLLNKGITKARKVRGALDKTIGKKTTNAVGKGLNKMEDSFGNFTIGTMVAGGLFLVAPDDLEAKQICEEK